MDKNQLHTQYQNELKSKHLKKQYQNPLRVYLTGLGRPSSIAEEIQKGLQILGVEVNKGQWIDEDVKCNTKGHGALVCCHGVAKLNWFEDFTDQDVRCILDNNLLATIRVIQDFVRDNIDQPHRKKIVVIGSMAYRQVLNGSSIYCAAKAGVAMLVKCLAWELAPKGFDVFAIHPSNVLDAPMSEDTIQELMRYRKLTREEAEAYWANSCPRESFLTKQEIAEHVSYLLLGNTGYLSGSNIELTGGQR